MITIYKYQFVIADAVEILMQQNAKILSVQLQDGIPTMWALVDTEPGVEIRHFEVVGTGQQLDGLIVFKTHIGTIQANGLVWHIFE